MAHNNDVQRTAMLLELQDEENRLHVAVVDALNTYNALIEKQKKNTLTLCGHIDEVKRCCPVGVYIHGERAVIVGDQVLVRLIKHKG